VNEIVKFFCYVVKMRGDLWQAGEWVGRRERSWLGRRAKVFEVWIGR